MRVYAGIAENIVIHLGKQRSRLKHGGFQIGDIDALQTVKSQAPGCASRPESDDKCAVKIAVQRRWDMSQRGLSRRTCSCLNAPVEGDAAAVASLKNAHRGAVALTIEQHLRAPEPLDVAIVAVSENHRSRIENAGHHRNAIPLRRSEH